MKNLKLFILGIITVLFSACGGDFPPPSFSRSVNLNEVPHVAFPNMPGNSQVSIFIDSCSIIYVVQTCGAECGVRYVEFTDASSPNEIKGYYENLAITSNNFRNFLDSAKRSGCFEYNQPINITYVRTQELPNNIEKVNIVTITETFIR